jgi:hypothetical protein
MVRARDVTVSSKGEYNVDVVNGIRWPMNCNASGKQNTKMRAERFKLPTF